MSCFYFSDCRNGLFFKEEGKIELLSNLGTFSGFLRRSDYFLFPVCKFAPQTNSLNYVSSGDCNPNEGRVN
jgi:hypothetical protein